MRKLLILLVALAHVVSAEPQQVSISATATSLTTQLYRTSASVLICNWGANEVFYRLFDGTDTQGAATTSSIQLVAGTATAPVCKSYDKGVTEDAYYVAISTICSSAETATITVEFK